ncbi:cytochrome b/b6 domain-containing protein (plasmid) [Rahnella aceris]
MKRSLFNAIPYHYAPFFRALHIIIALLILSQIINSNFIEEESLGGSGIEKVMTWVHVVSGFSLIFFGLVLLAWMLTQRGFRWYYAWLIMDFRGVAKDLSTLRKFRLPDAAQGSIAASIQGLGVVALLLVACSGGLWFVANSWLNASEEMANYYLHLHKFLTTFIEIYFYAHGAMGILHMLLARKSDVS